MLIYIETNVKHVLYTGCFN